MPSPTQSTHAKRLDQPGLLSILSCLFLWAKEGDVNSFHTWWRRTRKANYPRARSTERGRNRVFFLGRGCLPGEGPGCRVGEVELGVVLCHKDAARTRTTSCFFDFSSSLLLPCRLSCFGLQIVWGFEKSILFISLRVKSSFLTWPGRPCAVSPVPPHNLPRSPDHSLPLIPWTRQVRAHSVATALAVHFARKALSPHVHIAYPVHPQVSAAVSPHLSGM